MDLMKEWKDRKKKVEALEKMPIKIELPKKQIVKRLYNIHKRSVPVGIDQIVVFNCESKEAAEHTIESMVDSYGNKKFNTRLYNDDSTETKTYIFYEAVPADATPKERSIYYNPPSFIKEG